MRKGVVIVLEDEDISMDVFRRVLDRGGYDCAEARSSEDVVQLCSRLRVAAKALIADLVLPHCRGTDAALAATRIIPGLPILFVSGTPSECWPDSDTQKMARLKPGSHRFLAKPFTPKDLLGELDGLLHAQANSTHA